MRNCPISLYRVALTLCALGLLSSALWADTSTSSSAAKTDTSFTIQSLRARAEELKLLSAQKPGTQEARDAMVEEVQVLTRLAPTQDTTLAKRRHELVTTLAADSSLSSETRCRLEAGSANADIATDQNVSPDAKMSAFADIAWKLVRKYPDRKQGYEALVRIARDSNDKKAQEIAQKLIASNAPESVKSVAEEILKRTALIGQSLSVLLKGSVEVSEGKICLFTWTSKKTVTLSLVEKLQRATGPGTTLIGVCLDEDVEAARLVAANYGMTCQLVYDTAGSQSALCQRLFLSGASKVYLTDSGGRIITVSGLNQLMATSWGIKNKATAGGAQ